MALVLPSDLDLSLIHTDPSWLVDNQAPYGDLAQNYDFISNQRRISAVFREGVIFDLENGERGSVVGGELSWDSEVGEYYSFSGTAGQGITFNVPSYTSASGEVLTIRLVVRTTDSGTKPLIDLRTITSSGPLLLLRDTSLAVFDGNKARDTYLNTSAGTDLRDGEWHTIIWEHEFFGEPTRMWIDGTLYADSETRGTTAVTTGSTVTIANNAPKNLPTVMDVGGAEVFFGRIDEIYHERLINSPWSTLYTPIGQAPFLFLVPPTPVAFEVTGIGGSCIFTGRDGQVSAGFSAVGQDGSVTLDGMPGSVSLGFSGTGQGGSLGTSPGIGLEELGFETIGQEGSIGITGYQGALLKAFTVEGQSGSVSFTGFPGVDSLEVGAFRVVGQGGSLTVSGNSGIVSLGFEAVGASGGLSFDGNLGILTILEIQGDIIEFTLNIVTEKTFTSEL